MIVLKFTLKFSLKFYDNYHTLPTLIEKCGRLYIKKGTPIASIISGGAQEFGMRTGTENVAAIVDMAAALKNNVDRIREVTKHLQQLEQALLDALDNAKIDYVRNGENHLPGFEFVF